MEDLKKIHGLMQYLKALSKEYNLDLDTPYKRFTRRIC